MTAAHGGGAKGEAEIDNGPVDRCPVERARQGWRALAFARSRDSAALKAGLDGNIIRATQLEEIAAKK
jgi:hypothetical protein